VNFLRCLALQEKILDSSQLSVFEIAHFPDMLPSFIPSWLGHGLISTPGRILMNVVVIDCSFLSVFLIEYHNGMTRVKT